jgi:hypothetical protein
MSTLTSSSALTEIEAASIDNASYEEDGYVPEPTSAALLAVVCILSCRRCRA